MHSFHSGGFDAGLVWRRSRRSRPAWCAVATPRIRHRLHSVLTVDTRQLAPVVLPCQAFVMIHGRPRSYATASRDATSSYNGKLQRIARPTRYPMVMSDRTAAGCTSLSPPARATNRGLRTTKNLIAGRGLPQREEDQGVRILGNRFSDRGNLRRVPAGLAGVVQQTEARSVDATSVLGLSHRQLVGRSASRHLLAVLEGAGETIVDYAGKPSARVPAGEPARRAASRASPDARGRGLRCAGPRKAAASLREARTHRAGCK